MNKRLLACVSGLLLIITLWVIALYKIDMRQSSSSSSKLDFTYLYYENLLCELENPRYHVLNVSGFIRLAEKGELATDKVTVIIRHDVDAPPESAMILARIEKKHNFTSTFYIRTRCPYNPLEPKICDWIKWLNKNGFEVGLHYEELYLANYNFTYAVEMFKFDLKLLRTLCPVVTVYAHGSSANPTYINYDIFRYNFTTLEENGLLGEAYLTVFGYGLEIKYLGDSHESWKPFMEELVSTKEGEIIYFLFHPCYWHE